jgi:hypothetical protein
MSGAQVPLLQYWLLVQVTLLQGSPGGGITTGSDGGFGAAPASAGGEVVGGLPFGGDVTEAARPHPTRSRRRLR